MPRERKPLGGLRAPGKNWTLLLYLWGGILIAQFFFSLGGARPMSYSDFRAALAAGQVEEVTLSPTTIRGLQRRDKGKSAPFQLVRVEDPDLLRDLTAKAVKVTGAADAHFWTDWLPWLLPLGLFALWGWQRMGGRTGQLLAVGQSHARVYMEKEVHVHFSDVAGVDEAKGELTEVVEFLREPEKFGRLGGRVPKGILLVGPPGTGKTLLARAVAGEAGVPFLNISGSEFVEMFVGVGAARVRDLFNQAKQKAPSIIFIDELDALGKVRSAGPMAHEEREQTLNQLLVELDGFDSRVGVILMAATNRPETLDPALLRAGRFDRHVVVDRPDRAGRLAILALHAKAVKLAPEVKLQGVAEMTAGMVGADLANIINEAALIGVRRGKEQVGQPELEEAVERVLAGLERKSRALTQAEKERVAHHESGHALVAKSLPHGDPVKKVSIIPRGITALGYTMQVPTEDRYLLTRAELEDRIATLFGGRAAEEVSLGDSSTGARDDLLKATQLAREMVIAYGMGEGLEHLSLAPEQQAVFVGALERPTHGDVLEREVDAEVRRILDVQYRRARALVEANLSTLQKLAASLLVHETLSGDAVDAIFTATGARRGQPLANIPCHVAT